LGKGSEGIVYLVKDTKENNKLWNSLILFYFFIN
jgi:hypothetical protein